MDFKTRFSGKLQKISKDGQIEDMTQLSEQKPIQKVSLAQLQETDNFN
jgi:hypothetical protein